jgi:serine/threonine protein phosphatase 1
MSLVFIRSKVMGIFIVGDVHGCLNTFLKLLDHWDPKSETLIQVGDLVDRGAFSPGVIHLAFELQMNFKKEAHFLRGNHEQLMINYMKGEDPKGIWLSNGGGKTLRQFEVEQTDPDNYSTWLTDLPLIWENDFVQVSHAGFSGIGDPYDQSNTNGLLWNRNPLINTGKLQVIGHTPRWDGVPKYSPESNSWNIDTGAYGGICLTGIRLEDDGTFIETVSVPTETNDMF